MEFREHIRAIRSTYKEIQSSPREYENVKMSEGHYALDGDLVLALPNDKGDSRYPYGSGGFNFWTYASGYMHCNEGLFSPFLRASEGAEPKIAYYVKLTLGDDKHLIPILSIPVVNDPLKVDRYTVFSQCDTLYVCETKYFVAAIKVFVDDDSGVYFQTSIEKLVEEPIELEFAYYLNPFVKNALVENSVDRWFRQVRYEEVDDQPAFVVAAYEEVDRSKMAPNYGVVRIYAQNKGISDFEPTTSRYAFVGGSRDSLHYPKGLMADSFAGNKLTTSFTETGICGGRYRLGLALEQPWEMAIRFTYAFDETYKDEQLEEKFDLNTVDKCYSTIRQWQNNEVKGLDIRFDGGGTKKLSSERFNAFLPHLVNQVTFCSEIKGYIQLSSFSLIGIRDIFQAVEGAMFYDPSLARSKMIEAFGFMTKEGRMPRQYVLPKEPGQIHSMDLRPFIDQGAWVISTMITYLKVTKDFSILKVPVGYYRFIDEDKHLAVKDEGSGTVLSHMMSIMDYLLSNQDTGDTECIYALYGDWNDALDGLGKSLDPTKKYGTGVSVMASLQVYQNLTEMVELLTYLKKERIYKDDKAVDRYTQKKALLKQGLMKHAVVKEGDETKILHGWGDHRTYLVGGFKDPDGFSRDGLTSNAFWILSDIIKEDERLQEPILKAFDRLEGRYGYLTFSPAFEPNSEGVGRIGNLPKGTAENGATYIHASLFAIMSLFKMGESKKAWEQLYPLLPITHEHVSCSPFVMPNSYGYNEDMGIDGESMADWQTGSSNVLLKILVRYIIGFEPTMDGLMIQTAKNLPFDRFDVTLDYGQSSVTLHYRKTGGERHYRVDGKIYGGNMDPLMKLNVLNLSDSYLQKNHVVIDVID